MQIIPMRLPEVKLIVPKVFEDDRGFFMETFRQDVFDGLGLPKFCQDNHSRSEIGTLRGLHYQVPPKAQAKLVRCTQGVIFDVAVDIRRDSPTFGQWVGEILSEENKQMLYIPSDFAHGFYVMSEVAEVQYKCSDYYAPELEGGIRYDDPQFGIVWPFIDGAQLLLSKRDSEAEYFI